jgi:hypothetical protein
MVVISLSPGPRIIPVVGNIIRPRALVTSSWKMSPKVGSVGIIDWEIAGYYPRGWIRTKFRICSGLDIPNPVKEQHWWRWEVQKSLGEHGFEDYSEKWGSWWY